MDLYNFSLFFFLVLKTIINGLIGGLIIDQAVVIQDLNGSEGRAEAQVFQVQII